MNYKEINHVLKSNIGRNLCMKKPVWRMSREVYGILRDNKMINKDEEGTRTCYGIPVSTDGDGLELVDRG